MGSLVEQRLFRNFLVGLVLSWQGVNQVSIAQTASTQDNLPTSLRGSLAVSESNKSAQLSANASRSSIEVSLLPASITILNNVPLSNYRGKKVAFVELKLRNNSNQVVIVDGDNSQAECPKGDIRASNAGFMVQGASANLSSSDRKVLTAVYLMSLGLAGPIFYELKTPQQHAKRYLGRSISIDGVRHEVEMSRFGRRLIMPGDETNGWLSFACDEDEAIKFVKVPVWFSPMRTPATFLNLPVQNAANL